jgi:dethiobiotin synthetase
VSVLIVSGTGTEVGKTVTTAALAALAVERGSSVVVVKPAQTGVWPGEPGDLTEIERLVPGVSGVELARYPDPLSPEAAARTSGLSELSLDLVANEVLRVAGRYDLVLVEGAGGLLVRYASSGWTVAELARCLDAPVLIVTEAELGTLNHTALTLEALANRQLQFAGLVLGSWPADPDLTARCNLHDLSRLIGQPLSGVLPAGASEQPDFPTVARQSLSPSLGGTFDAANFALIHTEGDFA